jgi:diaminohydroxyphosphoribosylaminopyrimidine deaminase / 5-amino-6-(5-phosphoribosylamino)uracil reductase
MYNNDLTAHEKFMQRCLQLARLGAGHVAPNPMVGSVLVHEGRIIGEGYHQLYGQAHAEVNCVAAVSEEDKSLIPAATMYVSLEPCAHYGKTPPCANMIVAQRIPRVVIGCVDTFSQVAGKGIEILRNAGVEVTTGVLEKECRELNHRFFTYHEQQRPYIILKWAQTPAGFVATKEGQPVRISNQYSDRLVHRWRSEEMSILVGTKTALADNPRLNNRLWTGNNPIRLVLDRELKIPRDYHLWDNSIPTIFFTAQQPENEQMVQLDFNAPLVPQLLRELYNRRIQSVLVEGGPHLLTSFITAGIWDEARIITGQTELSEGLPAPRLTQAQLETEIELDGDLVSIYRHA